MSQSKEEHGRCRTSWNPTGSNRNNLKEQDCHYARSEGGYHPTRFANSKLGMSIAELKMSIAELK